MRHDTLLGSIIFLTLATTSPALAEHAHWTIAPATRAQITGGPWVIAEGLTSYPAPNPGTNNFQPYYQSFTTGTDTTIEGYFDYRPKNLGEAIVAARSTDSGKTWTFQSKVLEFDSPSLANDAQAASDDGEGHPFVMSVGSQTLLYTLDRDPSSVDLAGLLVRAVTPTSQDPLAGAPAMASPGSTQVQRTVGLTTPDGILSRVPGAQNNGLLYLAKDISLTPNTTTVHYVETTDGVHFSSDVEVTGLVDLTNRPFIGPRGTIVKYSDGTFGLFFSAGLVGEDADAFHYIGYAESNDGKAWTVINDLNNPLVSIDATKDPNGGATWYAGRVYAPGVTLSADGCTATLVFSGYMTKKVTASDYRQVGRATLSKAGCGGAADAGDAPDASPAGDGSVSVDAGLADDGGGSSESPSASSGCSCSEGPSRVALPGLFAALAVVATVIGRRRRRVKS